MKVVIIGGGGNLKSIVASNKGNTDVKFEGYTDIIDKGTISGLKYLGYEKKLNFYNKNVLISIVYLKNPKDRKLRETLIKDLIKQNAVFPNIISPCSSVFTNLKLNRGNLLINSVFINTDVCIGSFNFLNSKVIIEHDVKIGDNNIFSPGVIVGGEVKIGNNNFFGMGVIIRDGISICNNVIIGMGSIVTKSIKKEGFYFGIPAKIQNI